MRLFRMKLWTGPLCSHTTTDMQDIWVRPATMDDIGILGVVGPAAYVHAYGYLWDRPEALAAQLRTFGAAAFEAWLGRPDTRLWVGEAAGTVVGFLSMRLDSPDPVQRRSGGAEIPRIYLLPGAQRFGLGRRLVEAAITEARAEAMSHVWLDVMASADWARRAYVKWGFEEIGRTRFDRPVKPESADMIVLAKEL